MAINRRLPWIVLVIVLAVVGFCGGILRLGCVALRAVPHSLVNVSSRDANLQKAIAEARSLLPKFEDRLKHPEAGDRFAIEAKFDTGSPEGPEYLWMKNPVRTPKGFSGVVDQPPVLVPNLKKGDKEEVPESAVVDWLIQRADGSETGGFTNLALGGSPG